MKRFLFFSCFISYLQHASAQIATSVLSYESYQNYNLGAYLNTPLSNLRMAGIKWQNGDSAAALQYIAQSIQQGLFDSTMIVNSTNLKGVTGTAQWLVLKKRIEQNLQAISKPEQLKIVSDDVARFIKIYPQLFGKNGDALLWSNYITQGSNGLKTFFNVRMSSRSDLFLNVIKKHQHFYAGLAPLLQQLPSFTQEIQNAATKLEQIYPEAIFPPIYFLVGNLNAAGTADGGAGQLVGLEFFSDYQGRDTSELNTWEKSVLSDTARMVGVIVHEMIHVQQKGASGQNVLAKCITEGSADFMTYLLLNKIILPRQHAYGNAHEKELWERLLKERNSTDLSYWMYNTQMEGKGIPSDLGYYVGFKICEAYYRNHPDKAKAIKAILEINDFDRFFRESGYAKKFE